MNHKDGLLIRLQSGMDLGAYTVGDRISEGNSSTIYSGFRTATMDEVTIKQVEAHLTNEPVYSFSLRARSSLLSQNPHPGIVAIYDFIEEKRGSFLIMEPADGNPVGKWLDAGDPLDWREVMPLAQQLLKGLRHLHRLDMVHGAIRPEHIFVSNCEEGSPQARLLVSGVSDVWNGSPWRGAVEPRPYMSPEHVGNTADLRPQSDVFSLGMVLYQALAGRLPFDKDASADAISRAIVGGHFPDISTFVELPANLARIVRKATARDVGERYANAEEMLLDLDVFEALGPETTPAMEPSEAVPAEVLELNGTGKPAPNRNPEPPIAPSSEPYVEPQTLPQPSIRPPAESDPSRRRRRRPKFAWMLLGMLAATGFGMILVSAMSSGSLFSGLQSGVDDHRDSLRVEASDSIQEVRQPAAASTLPGDPNEPNRIETPNLVEPVVVSSKPRPAAAARPARKLQGTVRIDVTPWANVFIDGKMVAERVSGTQEFVVDTGRHQIRVENASLFAERERIVEVQDGDSPTFRFDLSYYQSVQVTAVMPDGRPMEGPIILDAVPTGKNTPAVLNLQSGPHTLLVSDPRYFVDELDLGGCPGGASSGGALFMLSPSTQSCSIRLLMQRR